MCIKNEVKKAVLKSVSSVLMLEPASHLVYNHGRYTLATKRLSMTILFYCVYAILKNLIECIRSISFHSHRCTRVRRTLSFESQWKRICHFLLFKEKSSIWDKNDAVFLSVFNSTYTHYSNQVLFTTLLWTELKKRIHQRKFHVYSNKSSFPAIMSRITMVREE